MYLDHDTLVAVGVGELGALVSTLYINTGNLEVGNDSAQCATEVLVGNIEYVVGMPNGQLLGLETLNHGPLVRIHCLAELFLGHACTRLETRVVWYKELRDVVPCILVPVALFLFFKEKL